MAVVFNVKHSLRIIRQHCKISNFLKSEKTTPTSISTKYCWVYTFSVKRGTGCHQSSVL